MTMLFSTLVLIYQATTKPADSHLEDGAYIKNALLRAQKTPKRTDVRLPRLCLVYNETIFYYFEDWVEPLLFSLGMFFDIVKMPGPAMDIHRGDTVLLLQTTQGHRKMAGVEYWFLNTEGPDKSYAQLAIDNGFKNIIDYDLFNTERLAARGADVSLWLPVIHPSTVTVYTHRDKLCMIGGANTPRREMMLRRINRLAQKRGLPVTVHEIKVWGFRRDVLSQTCALVVNIASRDDNFAVPRLRLDLLWSWDIPIVSESAAGFDSLEYLGTVTFVPLNEVPKATLDHWEAIMLQKSDNIVTKALNRQTIQNSRMEQYQMVVNSIASSALQLYLEQSCRKNEVID